MEWAKLISVVLTSSILVNIGSAVLFFIFWRQNKTIKDNEAKGSNLEIEEKELEIDRKQIDLGNEFMKSSLEMTRKMQEMMAQNQQRDEKNWNEMFTRMDSMEKSVTNIRLYLNGGLAEFEDGLKHMKK